MTDVAGRVGRAGGLGGFVVLMSVVVGGCSSSPSTPFEEAEPAFREQIEVAIEDARVGGASDTQLQILNEALDTEAISFEAAHSAAVAAVDCMNAAGLSARYKEQSRPSGPATPGYVADIGLDDDGTNEAILSRCDAQEDFWVNLLYQTQPSSVALEDARIESLAPAFRECLESNGIDVDSSATGSELQRQAIDVLVETEGAIDCLSVGN